MNVLHFSVLSHHIYIGQLISKYIGHLPMANYPYQLYTCIDNR